MNAFWVAFLLPFVLLPLAGWSWRVKHPGSYNAPAVARGRCILFAAIGLIIGVWCVARLPALMDASTLYLTDPSCTAGTAAAAARPGAPCRSEMVAIARTRVHSGGRSGTHYYFTLERHDGSRSEVEVRTNYAGPVWREAVAAPGLSAHLQTFRGRPALIGANDGVVRTEAFPPDQVRPYQFMALFSAGLLAASLIDIAFSWQSLF